jgi:ATP-dependent Lon protease
VRAGLEDGDPGLVLPVGGIKEKLVAAAAAGLIV